MQRLAPVSGQRASAALLAVLLMVPVACRPASTVKPASSHTVELSVVDPAFVEREALQHQVEEKFTQSTGIGVRSIAGNESTDGLLAQELELLQPGAPFPDVCSLDNVWAGNLSPYLLDLTPYVPKSLIASYIPEVLKAYQVGGKLVALPQETEFPILYYRTDLLQKYKFKRPPQTWDELEQMALTIQEGERKNGNSDFWGYLWQGAPTETLTCVAQEYQISSGGGRILEENGTVSLNNSQAAKAFTRAARWINWISPPGTTAYLEEDVENVWEEGNGAFARNWAAVGGKAPLPASPLYKKVGVAILPHDPGAQSASTIGGYGYGVSKYSRHPREAAELAQTLTSRAFQALRFERSFAPPAFIDLYSDPAMHRGRLFFQPIKSMLFRSAVARPSAVAGPHYREVSHAYAQGIHSILTHQATAPEALAALGKELGRIMHGETAVHGSSLVSDSRLNR